MSDGTGTATRYALLLLPAANRVYTESAPRLLRAELGVLNERALAGTLRDIRETRHAGVAYITCTAAAPLSEEDIALLSNLSSLYALFEVLHAGDDTNAGQVPGSGGEPGWLLRPVAVYPMDRFDSDLLTIQKYAGKTNEVFTRLLVNVTCMALADPRSMLHTRLRLLDPLCGRGTTLNQAMTYGFDAAGSEANSKDFEAYERFIKTWLRNKRFKHTAESGDLRKDKVRLGRRLDVSYAATKHEYTAGEARSLRYRNVDTMLLGELFAPGSFDLVVADAPYGVAHGSHTAGKQAARNPRALLAEAVPLWATLLRSGGALGISFNTSTVSPASVRTILRSAGLTVAGGQAFEGFEHRVDQAIVRDLVVATKPSG